MCVQTLDGSLGWISSVSVCDEPTSEEWEDLVARAAKSEHKLREARKVSQIVCSIELLFFVLLLEDLTPPTLCDYRSQMERSRIDLLSPAGRTSTLTLQSMPLNLKHANHQRQKCFTLTLKQSQSNHTECILFITHTIHIKV